MLTRTSDSSVGSLAQGARAAGRGFDSWESQLACLTLIISVVSHAWCHKGTATCPSHTEPWRFPVISRRTRSSYLCVVVGLIVHVWCECGVRVCVYEQMLQLYPDERCQKKKSYNPTILASSYAGTQSPGMCRFSLQQGQEPALQSCREMGRAASNLSLGRRWQLRRITKSRP